MSIENFERSGVASLDDFAAPGYAAIFAHLEAVQREFLAHEAQFRSPEYRWERDTLHGWSRCWEYPFAYYHMRAWRNGCAAAAPPSPLPLVLDLGSGVTFFPFAIAREGCAVACVDVDPVAERDVKRAAAAVYAAPGLVEFRTTDGVHLPLGDGEAEAAYCISVLEHVEDPRPLVAEVARALRPGAPFVLTIDLDLKGTSDIGPEKYAALRRELDARFELIVPERTVHPARMLDSYNGPYPRAHERQVPGIMWRTRENKLLPLVGGPIADDPIRLACFGAVMRRPVR